MMKLRINNGLSSILLFTLLFSCSVNLNKKVEDVEPQRVVVIGQSALEFMLRFELEDKIVGIAQIDSQNEKLEVKLAQLPIITRQWPSKEAILALKPDFIYGMESAFRAERLGSPSFWQERGVNVCIINDFSNNKTISLYKKDLTRSGEIFNKKDEIDNHIAELEYMVDSLKSKREHSKTKPRVLFLACVGSAYYYYPSSLCVLDEVIEDCGGKYLNLGGLAFILSTEAIIKADPDKIIISNYRYSDASVAKNTLIANEHFKLMKAIKNEEILTVDYTNAVSGSLELDKLYNKVYSFINK